MMTPEIELTPAADWGALCDDCGEGISEGDPIALLEGRAVCEDCISRRIKEDGNQ